MNNPRSENIMNIRYIRPRAADAVNGRKVIPQSRTYRHVNNNGCLRDYGCVELLTVSMQTSLCLRLLHTVTQLSLFFSMTGFLSPSFLSSYTSLQ